LTVRDPGRGPSLQRLTAHQERFVREYIRTGNAKRAATLAGYSVRSAKQIGSVLLKKPQIQSALEALRESQVPNEPDLTADRALRMLVEETADPNPRVRLDARVQVARALGVFEQKEKEPESCASCARREALESLSDDDLALRVAGTTKERILAMTNDEFQQWRSAVRAEAERWILIAHGVHPGAGRGTRVDHAAPSG